MKLFFSKIIVTFLTFFLGIVVTFIFHKPFDEQSAKTNLVANQQNTSVTPVSNEEVKSELESLSPYDIESFINLNPQTNIEEIWERLEIADKYSNGSHNESEGYLFTDCSGCEAKTYNVELDGEQGTEVLLRVEDKSQETCRYLVFKYKSSETNKDKWRLIGHIDHNFGRYQMPQHYFLLSGGKRWLIIRGQVASGSGVSLYYDRLFTIQNDRIVEVLSYPAEGHQSEIGFEPSRSFGGNILDCESENGIITVQIELTVNYITFNDTNNDIPLWSKKQRAIFKKNLKSNKTIFDEKNSDLSKQEVEAVYNIDSLSGKDLLKYNFEKLRQIAKEKQSKQKQWLSEFLRICKPSLEKSALQKILTK